MGTPIPGSRHSNGWEDQLKRWSRLTDEATAYHEAGHAIAHWALHRPFEYVTVVPDGERLGHVRTLDLPPDFTCAFVGNSDALVWDRAVICLYGPVATSVLCGEPVNGVDDWAELLTSDDIQALDMAMEHGSVIHEGEGGVDASATMDALLAAALGIMVDSWGAVVALAEALLAEETLTDIQVWDIARSAPRRMPPGQRGT